ncbi:MAG: hypothetical protein Q9209_005776, partial [Squamulea sp. 1 TL-2023]
IISQTQIVDSASSPAPSFDLYHSYLNAQSRPRDLQAVSNKEAGGPEPTSTQENTSAEKPGGLGDNESAGPVKDEKTLNPTSTRPEEWWDDASHGPSETSQRLCQIGEADKYHAVPVSAKAFKDERERLLSPSNEFKEQAHTSTLNHCSMDYRLMDYNAMAAHRNPDDLVKPGWGWETPYIEREKDASLKAAQAKERLMPLDQDWWEARLADRERYWESKLHNAVNLLEATTSEHLISLAARGQTIMELGGLLSDHKELQSKFIRMQKRCDNLVGGLRQSALEAAYYKAQCLHVEAINDNVTIPKFPGINNGKSGKLLLTSDRSRKS